MVQQTKYDLINNYSKAKLDPQTYMKYIERILKECLSVEEFEKEDREKAIDFFICKDGVPRCVYCGASEKESEKRLVWDHIVPAIQSGDAVLGNMVIACTTCNASKRQMSYQAWLDSCSKKSLKGQGESEADINKVRKTLEDYIDRYDYSHQADLAHKTYCEDQKDKTPQLVTFKLESEPEIRKQYEKLYKDIETLREDLKDLSRRYKEAKTTD